jgi:hypothetical protein
MILYSCTVRVGGKAAHAMFRIEMLCVHSSHVFYTSFISFFTVDNSSHVSFVGLPQC